MPKISVIIPTIGRAYLKDLTESLQRQTLAPFEIITIFDDHRKGASWARNVGVRKAKGEFVAMIDDDCIPSEAWLKELYDGLISFGGDIAGGVYEETDGIMRDLQTRKKIQYTENCIDTHGIVGRTGNILFKKDLLDKCVEKHGYLLDENLEYGEDMELMWRLSLLGAKVIYVQTKPVHMKTFTVSSFMKWNKLRGRGIAQMKKAISSNKESSKFYQNSLIWNSGNQKKNYTKAIIFYLFGPFDVSNFSSFKNFVLVWIGEKVKAGSYVFERIKNR